MERVIENVSKSVESIEMINTTIGSITSQTNLLALFKCSD